MSQAVEERLPLRARQTNLALRQRTTAAHASQSDHGGLRLSPQLAGPAPVSSSAPDTGLTACNSHQALQQIGSVQARGIEQQHASRSGVRPSALLPHHTSGEQSSTKSKHSSSSRPGNVATLQQHGTAHPLQLSAGMRASPTPSGLPQHATAQQMQLASRPQVASAPSAAMPCHGTGVFSVCDADDDDLMLDKLLEDISKADSVPGASSLHLSREPAAGPQGWVMSVTSEMHSVISARISQHVTLTSDRSQFMVWRQKVSRLVNAEVHAQLLRMQHQHADVAEKKDLLHCRMASSRSTAVAAAESARPVVSPVASLGVQLGPSKGPVTKAVLKEGQGGCLEVHVSNHPLLKDALQRLAAYSNMQCAVRSNDSMGSIYAGRAIAALPSTMPASCRECMQGTCAA